MTRGRPSSASDCLAAILRGEPVRWNSLRITPADLIDAGARHDLTGLLYHQISQTGDDHWSSDRRDDLKRAARLLAAEELLRQREIVSALDALATADVHPILLKGAALAYAVYAEPMSRPRVDTDLLIRRDDIDAARRALHACGYRATVQCDGALLFRQFALSKTDAFGIEHTFDVHWKVSTQTLFADLVTYDELGAEAVAVGALGSHARAAGPVHALLLACVHPAMHHRKVERLLWVYDVHLLAARLSEGEFDRFAALAVAKQVAAIVRHELARARERYGTRVPERILARLAAAGREPSAAYLRSGRRWHHELLSNMQALSAWTDRRRLFSDVLFPGRGYMLARYGLRMGSVRTLLLPALYLHRGVHGLWKIAIGRK